MTTEPTSDLLDAGMPLLETPLGYPGSGKLRYAAAVAAHRRGELSDAALEVYRICSPLDHLDPRALLADLGLTANATTPASDIPPAAILRNLLAELACYLASLTGPGMAEVRQGLAHWQDGPFKLVAPRTASPVLQKYLPVALGELQNTHPALADAIGMAAPHLGWTTYDQYPPELIGGDFLANHVFAPIIGEQAAPFPAENWELGLFLIAPQVLYRDHFHAAPELYAPLTGPHGWRFGPDRPLIVKPAHAPVWNEPNAPHLTKVGSQPFLCIYVWTTDVSAPAQIISARDWAELEALVLAD